jgi:hypothetical protein
MPGWPLLTRQRQRVPGAVVPPLGRPARAGGHPGGQPDQPQPAGHRQVRLGIGATRDLVLIEGTVLQTLAAGQIPNQLRDVFAAKTGFDPRQLTSPYQCFRIELRRLQAWREANELTGRELMRDGHWRVAD